MQTVAVIAAVVAAVGAAVAAGAGVWTAVIYKRLLQVSQDQVRIGQEQVRVSQDQVRIGQEQIYAQHRPILIPSGDLPVIELGMGIDWSKREWPISLQNVGTGVALHIKGVLLGAKPTRPATLNERYALWDQPPILPGAQSQKEMQQGMTAVPGDRKIGGYTLFASDPPRDHMQAMSMPWVLARLTLTYHDVYGRKHATIFEYTQSHGWNGGMNTFLVNIDWDLEELNTRALVSAQGPGRPRRLRRRLPHGRR
jgi:hypothetical protein